MMSIVYVLYNYMYGGSLRRASKLVSACFGNEMMTNNFSTDYTFNNWLTTGDPWGNKMKYVLPFIE